LPVEKGEAGLPYRPGDPGLGPVRDLLGDERLQIRVIAHALAFGTEGELPIESPHGRQMEAAQHAIQIMDWRRRHARGSASTALRSRGARAHDAASCTPSPARAASWTTYSAPISR